MAAAAILNFAKDYNIPSMANSYQCTKFEENIYIHNRYIAKKSKIQDGGCWHLEFCKCKIFGYTVNLVWTISNCVPDLTNNLHIGLRYGQKSKIHR